MAIKNTKPTTSTPSLPIGSVVAYAGDLSVPANLQALKAAGWLLCDGSSYNSTTYPDLYKAIGTSNGGNASGAFNVPDLRDRFVRGWNSTAMQPGTGITIDPDVSTRIAAALGGATGNNVGSLQHSATALPMNSFVLGHSGTHHHFVLHLTSDMHMAWDGSTYTMARWNGPATTDVSGAHNHTLSGYDATSSPISMALYYIIKASQPQTPDGTIPAGVMAGFAGSVKTMPTNWLRCDGMAYGLTVYPDLSNLISCNYGGDGISVFNVPDFRGNFIRGTNHATGRDPNAAQRHALNTGGSVGDETGSAQGYATMQAANLQVATGGAHSHNIAKVPQNDHHAAWGASGPLAYNCMEWTDGSTQSTDDGDHTHSLIGGDKETRPENIYLDWLVSSANLSSAAPPIGAIMPAGCDTTNVSNLVVLLTSGWLPCDGSSLKISDPNYKALYNVIKTMYGGDNLKFKVPDLRGYLVAGAGGQRAIGNLQQVSKTGAPVNPIVTTTDGDHQHTINNIPTDTHEIDVVAGVDLAENNPNESPTSTDGAHTHSLSGGDLESRCINVYADYIIRYK